MSILKIIHEAIEASRTAGDFNISEDPGHLWVGGRLSSAALLAWQAVFDNNSTWLIRECVDESQDRIQPKDGRQDEKLSINLRFTSPNTTPHIFTPEGWRSFLLSENAVYLARFVRLAFIANAFETRAFIVKPWIDTPSDEPTDLKKISDTGPRRQVRCQSPDLMAPLRIEPWILASSASNDSLAIRVWNKVAAEMIAKSLPNELYIDGNTSKVSLAGQPPRRIELGVFQTNEPPIKILQETAKWLYLEGEDVEVRHTFLTAELARAWTPDVCFCDGLTSRLAGALDSARLVYKAHLRSGSKDIIKALADLRKTLSDEVQKLLQQSRDLSGAVWRDVAIAIGVLGVRLAVDSVKANSMTLGFATIYFLVAIYIMTSYRISIATNNKFLEIVETARRAWRTKLYAFLDDDDYQTLADKPLTDALKAYRVTQARTTAVVEVVVFFLVFGAIVEAHWIEVGRSIQIIKDILNIILVYLENLVF